MTISTGSIMLSTDLNDKKIKPINIKEEKPVSKIPQDPTITNDSEITLEIVVPAGSIEMNGNEFLDEKNWEVSVAYKGDSVFYVDVHDIFD